jgi:hypothetical protein
LFELAARRVSTFMEYANNPARIVNTVTATIAMMTAMP